MDETVRDSIMGYQMEELLPVVAELTDRYTSKESSSVTYETAMQLMKAVIYCIRSCKGENEIASDNKLAAKAAYQTGYEKVIELTKSAQQKYNEMIPNFNAYGNENYYDTVVKAIPGFFKLYDVRFAPQNTIITMDYPTMIPVNELEGIEAVGKYLEFISIEQHFLSKIPDDYIRFVLSAFQNDYKKQFYNICNIILRNILGCMLIDKPLLRKSTKDDYEELGKVIQQYEGVKLTERMELLLKRLITEQYRDDMHLFSYLREDLKNFSSELKNAAENDKLPKVVVLKAPVM